MNPIILGAIAALCWGSADFAARFTGRALGPARALFAVMLAGALALTTVAGAPPWPPSPWAVANGLAVVAAMLLFYEALRRGSISRVVPLVGAFPAWTVALMVAFEGARPSPVAWLAMATTMAGVWLVARYAIAGENPAEPAGSLVVPLSLGSSLLFGLAMVLGQHSAAVHGEVAALAAARWVGTLALLPAPLGGGRIPCRWLPVLALQGLADAGAFLALMAAGGGEAGAAATVVSSGFGLVAIALARLFLKERLAPLQWGGVTMVFCGVAALAAAR
jgi:uncharacterized membrane protein